METGGDWFWTAISPLWPTYAQVIGAAALVNLLALAAPLFIMNVYDRVLPNKAIATLWVLAIGMGIVLVFDLVLRMLRSAMIGNAGRRADVLLASRIFEHVLGLELGNRPSKTGEFANQLRDFEVVKEFFTSNTIAVVTDFLFIGLFLLVIYLIAGPLAWVPAIAVIIVLTIGALLQPALNRAVNRTQTDSSHRHSLLFEALTSLETIKCLRAESHMQRRWERFVGEASKTSEDVRYLSSIGLNSSGTVQQLVTVGVVVYGTYMFADAEVSIGAIIATVILASRAMAPLGQIAATMARAQQAFQSLRVLNAIMGVPEERAVGDRFADLVIRTGQIAFDNVTFSYPAADLPAINEFSLSIEPGERVGIIGKMGSGKTTLGRLVSRLYLPEKGSLLLDGIDVRQYHPTEIRKKVAFVAQDAALFHGSVRDNIAFGSPYASDDQIKRAADIAGVTDFISIHPHGFSLEVGEGGRFLSSGQRQAVTLARALIFDPLVVFLDEPSGAIDSISEQALIKRIRTAFRKDQTLIITTHRSSMLTLVDRLIVIDRGRVAADGPRNEILSRFERSAKKRSKK